MVKKKKIKELDLYKKTGLEKPTDLFKTERVLSHKHSSITQKLFLILLFLVVFSMITGNSIWIYFSSRIVRRNISEAQLQMAYRVSDHLEEFFEHIEHDIKEMIKDKDIPKMSVSEQEDFLESLMFHNESYSELSIIDKNGQEIVRDSRDLGSAFQDLKVFDQEDFFKKAISGEEYFSPVYISTSKPFMTIALPIRSSLEVFGVIKTEVDLEHISKDVGKIKLKETGITYIVDNTGRLIAHSDFSNVLENRNFRDREPVKETVFLKEVCSGLGENDVYIDEKGAKVLGAGIPYPKLGWGIIVEITQKEVFAPIFQMWLIIIFSVIAGTIWALLVSLWFSRWFTKPIKKLHKGAEIISQGNLDYKVNIRTNDEIEQLAETFNQMTKKLKNYYSGLEKIVKDRTYELEKAKNDLEKRTKELEKFNKLTVGRELKMIELKKKIRALQSKLKSKK